MDIEYIIADYACKDVDCGYRQGAYHKGFERLVFLGNQNARKNHSRKDDNPSVPCDNSFRRIDAPCYGQSHKDYQYAPDNAQG